MKENRKAVLICFNIQSSRFECNYERNKFFRALYGWKQTIKKETVKGKTKPKEKVYTYKREGLLDEIPHKKIDQSSFIVPEDEFERIERFFKEWRDKVIWRTFKILLDDDVEKFFKEEIDV